MLLDLSQVEIYVRSGHTDMRKATNGLTIMVQDYMYQNPLSGSLYLFCNIRRRILKALYWDLNGFCLWPMTEEGMRQISCEHLSPTSLSRKDHPVYPDLLKGKRIRYPNQVWATDITYLKLDVGFVFLAAIMDLYSREILSWRDNIYVERFLRTLKYEDIYLKAYESVCD